MTVRIVVTADIHADEAAEMGRPVLDRLCEQVHGNTPDVFIIAGDLVGLLKSHIAPTLEKLVPPGCLKLIVPGNHDLWLREGDSYWYYRELLPEIYSACGYHMLDTGPKVVGKVAFVGNVGWYDYSLHDPELPPSAYHDYDYETKTWAGMPIWMDAEFVRLGMSDREFNALLLSDLRRQIESIPPEVETIVAVTHHLALVEMVVRKPHDLEWNFCNAFQGSRALGELLLRFPRVKYHFCGHSHCRGRVARGSLTSINVGSSYERKRVEVLVI